MSYEGPQQRPLILECYFNKLEGENEWSGLVDSNQQTGIDTGVHSFIWLTGVTSLGASHRALAVGLALVQGNDEGG